MAILKLSLELDSECISVFYSIVAFSRQSFPRHEGDQNEPVHHCQWRVRSREDGGGQVFLKVNSDCQAPCLTFATQERRKGNHCGCDEITKGS